MKPNDKAYAAARKVAYNRINKCFVFDLIKEAVDAAYAAQLPPSEDYAELVKELRSSAMIFYEYAADALEAVLAERDDFAEQLALRNACKNGNGQFTLENTFQSLLDMIDLNVETAHEKIAAIEERDAAIKERDALLARNKRLQETLSYWNDTYRYSPANEKPPILEDAARLAPVDDKALVEIVADAISTYVPDQVSKWGSIKDAAIDAIAAIRPHIEAAERERIKSKLSEIDAASRTGGIFTLDSIIAEIDAPQQ